jgi:Zn-dependent M28 family amino/carboxypeptidase
MTLRQAGRTLLTLIALALVGLSAWWVMTLSGFPGGAAGKFDGQRALRDVQYQTSLGPRTPGSPAHDQIVAWMQAELESAGWQAEVQGASLMGHPIQNVVTRRSDQPPQIILAAHYDSRLAADRDPEPGKRSAAVPGAHDGATGVAVLLELARTLPEDSPPVWLVFLDAEDNGGLPGWDWLLGSRLFVAALEQKPRAAIILDMIGDADLNIYFEKNSDAQIAAQIWAQAARLGYGEAFIPVPKHSLLDDHIPFMQAGIPAVDIIDFDYPYWHTTADTADKVSAASLQAVGETLIAWISAQ